MTSDLLRRIDPSRLRSLVVTAALVGLAAGLLAAVFARVAGVPALEDAIAIEEARADDAGSGDAGAEGPEGDDEAVVSRSDQRGVGLFGAYGLTGAAFGALLGLTVHGLRRGRPVAGPRVLMAGVILAGSLTVAPWLKYPPNPPAVGDPDTVAERQALYVTVIVVAAVAGLAATVLSRRLRGAGWPDHRRVIAVTAAVAVPLLIVLAAMPPAPDEVSVPATLVWRFRLASLGANLTLWALLTLGVHWLVGEATARRQPVAVPPAGAGRSASVVG